MNAHQCDRCKLFDAGAAYARVELTTTRGIVGDNQALDLCARCYWDLRAALYKPRSEAHGATSTETETPSNRENAT